MEDLFSCGICFDQYSESRKPRVLECGHTYCGNCIQNLLERSRKYELGGFHYRYSEAIGSVRVRNSVISCPHCNKNISINSVEEIPVNWTLMEQSEHRVIRQEVQHRPIDPSIWAKYEKLSQEKKKVEKQKKQLETNFEENESLNKECEKKVREKFESIEDTINGIKDSFLDEIQKSRRENKIEYKVIEEKMIQELKRLELLTNNVQQVINRERVYDSTLRSLIERPPFIIPENPDYKLCKNKDEFNSTFVVLINQIQNIGHLNVIPMSLNGFEEEKKEEIIEPWAGYSEENFIHDRASGFRRSRRARRYNNRNPRRGEFGGIRIYDGELDPEFSDSDSCQSFPDRFNEYQLGGLKRYYYSVNKNKVFLNATYCRTIDRNKEEGNNIFNLVSRQGHTAFKVDLNTLKISKINVHGEAYPPQDLLREF